MKGFLPACMAMFCLLGPHVFPGDAPGPNQGASHAGGGGARMEAGDPAGERDALERAAGLAPGDARVRKRLGDSWLREDVARAREHWDAAILLDPDVPEYYLDPAWALMYSGDLSGGMEYLHKGFSRFPENREILLAAAFAQSRVDNHRLVDDLIRKLLSLDLGDREAIARGIMLSVTTGDMETAAMALNYLEGLEGDDGFPALAAGSFTAATGDNEAAIRAFSDALEKELPLHDRYHASHSLAFLLAGSRRFVPALEHARRSLAMLEANPGLDGPLSRWRLNTLVGVCLQEMGDEAGAAEHFAAAIASGHGQAADYLRYGSIRYRQGNGVEALKALHAGLERHPDDIGLLNLSARILIASGRPDVAVDLLRKIVAIADAGKAEGHEKEVKWARGLLEITKGK